MTDGLYEERFGPVGRRARRAWRSVRWCAKCLLRRRSRVLVEIRWRLGDEIMAIPIYEALKRRHPSIRLSVSCNHADILIDNPHVDAVNEEDPDPDRYILLRGAPRDVLRLEHYARTAGVPTPAARPKLYFGDWSTFVLSEPRGTPIVVCTGATWPTKRWPIERWRELCRRLLDEGHTVVQLGRKDEPVGVGTCLLNQTRVRDAACMLRAARLLICCDSGLMHLARAVDTPVLALFGPTDPSILIRDDPGFQVLTNLRACQGCWNSSRQMIKEGLCPLNVSECLGNITVDRVHERAKELLGVE